MSVEEAREPFALASPIGGAGFGMATFLVGLAYVGIYPAADGTTPAFMMVLFFAGLAQGVAGILELRRGSHALGFVHCSYGAWGLGQGTLVLVLGAGLLPAPSAAGWAAYWIGWAILTAILTVVVYPTSSYFAYVVGWLAVCFSLLAAGYFVPALLPVFGIALVVDALAAWYVTAAFSINESWDRTVLPVQ